MQPFLPVTTKIDLTNEDTLGEVYSDITITHGYLSTLDFVQRNEYTNTNILMNGFFQ